MCRLKLTSYKVIDDLIIHMKKQVFLIIEPNFVSNLSTLTDLVALAADVTAISSGLQDHVYRCLRYESTYLSTGHDTIVYLSYSVD